MQKYAASLVFGLCVMQACAPNAGPLDIANLYPPTSCGAPKEGDPGVVGGYLDTYAAASYQLRFLVITSLTGGGTADDLVVGGTILELKGREGIVINALKVSYTADPPVPGLADFTLPLAVMPNPGSNSKYYLAPLEIIGPETAKALMALPTGHPTLTLYAKIVFQGYTQRGGVKITSGPVIYPIAVNKSSITGCSKVWVTNGCSYLGQDSIITGSRQCCDGKCSDAGTTTGGVCQPPVGCE